MSLHEIVRSSRAGVIRVRNALNPLLWLSAVGPTLSWIAAYLLRDDMILRDGFAILGALPILGTLLAYFYLLFKDPDRLQSEEFILKQQELSILEHKGDRPSVLPNTDTHDVMLEQSPDLKG